MYHHKQLKRLIEAATKTYLHHAGAHGKVLQDLSLSFEEIILETTLKHFNGNLTLTAKSLGISRTTLYKKMKHHNFKQSTTNPVNL